MAANVYATLKQVLQDFFTPHFEAIRAEISFIRGDLSSPTSGIKMFTEKIDSVRNELKADIARIDEKLTFTNKRLDEALEIRERLAALEARVGRQ